MAAPSPPRPVTVRVPDDVLAEPQDPVERARFPARSRQQLQRQRPRVRGTCHLLSRPLRCGPRSSTMRGPVTAHGGDCTSSTRGVGPRPMRSAIARGRDRSGNPQDPPPAHDRAGTAGIRDAFTVVAPSRPGLAFSRPNHSPRFTHGASPTSSPADDGRARLRSLAAHGDWALHHLAARLAYPTGSRDPHHASCRAPDLAAPTTRPTRKNLPRRLRRWGERRGLSVDPWHQAADPALAHDSRWVSPRGSEKFLTWSDCGAHRGALQPGCC